MLEVCLSWKLPGDSDFTSLKLVLKPQQPDATTVEYVSPPPAEAPPQPAPVAAPEPNTAITGLPVLPPYAGPRKARNHPTVQETRYIKRLATAGYSYTEIGRHTRFSTTTIGRVIHGTHSPKRRG